MGHRLPFHKGKCCNLHGHTYKMKIILEGTEDDNGLVIDFYDLDKLLSPLIEEMDHSFAAQKDDKELIEALQRLNSRIVIMDKHTTVENISNYIIGRVIEGGLPDNISSVSVSLYETTDSYAEASRTV